VGSPSIRCPNERWDEVNISGIDKRGIVALSARQRNETLIAQRREYIWHIKNSDLGAFHLFDAGVNLR
jgi:hypothetical protein